MSTLAPCDPQAATEALAVVRGWRGKGGGCADEAECAPGLSDIEEVHASACASGRGSYIDPRTGYMVSHWAGSPVLVPLGASGTIPRLVQVVGTMTMMKSMPP